MSNVIDLRHEQGKELAALVAAGPTLVRFHGDFCGHCQAMKEAWNKLGEEMRGSGITVVDVEQSALSSVPDELKERVNGFPTIVSISKDNKSRVYYEGPRTTEDMKQWVMRVSKEQTQSGGRKKTKRGRKSRRASRKGKSRTHRTRRTSGRRMLKKRGGKQRRSVRRMH